MQNLFGLYIYNMCILRLLCGRESPVRKSCLCFLIMQNLMAFFPPSRVATVVDDHSLKNGEPRWSTTACSPLHVMLHGVGWRLALPTQPPYVFVAALEAPQLQTDGRHMQGKLRACLP